jgi:hypothetical protein
MSIRTGFVETINALKRVFVVPESILRYAPQGFKEPATKEEALSGIRNLISQSSKQLPLASQEFGKLWKVLIDYDQSSLLKARFPNAGDK